MSFDINNVNLQNEDVLRWMDYVRDIAEEVQQEFSDSPGLLLTEGDLQAMMFHKLYSSYDELSFPSESKRSGPETIKLHSEITWFKPEKKSGFEVDLTIFNQVNSDLINIDKIKDFPHKGFFHDGEALGIELKFIRDKSVQDSVEEDLDIIIKEIFPSKYARMQTGTYTKANLTNIGFVVIIGCKTDELFNDADHYLAEYIHANKIREYNFLEIILFSPNNYKTKLEYEA
jgi:hypothetical protein